MEAEGPYGRQGAAQTGSSWTNTGSWSLPTAIAEDVTRQRERRITLRRQAASDPLTGLAKLSLSRGCAGFRDQAQQSAPAGSLPGCFFDVDGLEIDQRSPRTYGGSQALCRLPMYLSSCCRTSAPLRASAGTNLLWCYRRPTQSRQAGRRRICEKPCQ